jgi:hypothetical protein
MYIVEERIKNLPTGAVRRRAAQPCAAEKGHAE